ncbi:hypothetical protein RUND412_003236 [Rhizina undulata]
MENPALFTTADHRIYLADSPIPTVGKDECLIHVRANGICGSDLHFWRTGEIGNLVVNSDYILGHEGAGVVVKIGENVKSFSVGDRVAIEPGVPCGECEHCSSGGDYNLCPEVVFTGAPPHNGSIRRYHNHTAKYLHRIPNSLSFSEGALLEPLSVVLHAAERSPFIIGEPALIVGAGPIGLISLAVAKASGAWPIMIIDIDEKRLEFAKNFVNGNVMVLNSASYDATEKVVDELLIYFSKNGAGRPKTVFECTGTEAGIRTAALAAKRGSEVMVVGVGRREISIPFMELSMAEVDLKFINRYHHQWPQAIRVLQSRYMDLKPLITHTFPLEKAVEALELVGNRGAGSIKVNILDDTV